MGEDDDEDEDEDDDDDDNHAMRKHLKSLKEIPRP